jgi:large subunit ribosomal protein L24
MKLKVGDRAVVIAGKEKGKEGKIIKIIKKSNQVVIEGLNMMKKHTKPSANDEKGGIIESEAPINASNVMMIDPKTKKPTRIGYSVDKNGKKIRIAKKSQEKLD